MSEGAGTHPTPSGSSPPSPPTVAGRAGAAHELGGDSTPSARNRRRVPQGRVVGDRRYRASAHARESCDHDFHTVRPQDRPRVMGVQGAERSRAQRRVRRTGRHPPVRRPCLRRGSAGLSSPHRRAGQQRGSDGAGTAGSPTRRGVAPDDRREPVGCAPRHRGRAAVDAGAPVWALVTIASTAAQRVDPTAAVYCATKYALRALSEGLHFVGAGGGPRRSGRSTGSGTHLTPPAVPGPGR